MPKASDRRVNPGPWTLNPNIARVLNSKTGREADVDWGRPVGLHEGSPVTIEYDLEAVARTGHRGKLEGLWRYAPLLPVTPGPAEYASDVGGTGIARDSRLSDELDCDVLIKAEGTNPTGSFKDRGLAMGVALGVACGARRFCLPTQGNAGVAASCFSARAGLEPALVYMPEGHRGSIYARQAAHFGADLRFFGANIAASGKRMRADLSAELASGAYVDLSTFFEPGRLEGKKTMGLEIADFFEGAELPAAILYPTGGGTGLVGIWKAFGELRKMGVLAGGRLPAMIAVQSEQCSPVVNAFDRGLDHVEPVTSGGTVADGLDVPGAIMGHAILRTLRESEGCAVAVTEDAMRADFARLGALGLCANYEGAATLAALRSLRRTGAVAEGSSVILLNTSNHVVGVSATNN